MMMKLRFFHLLQEVKMNEDILITTKDFDHSKEILKLKGKGIGAIVSLYKERGGMSDA